MNTQTNTVDRAINSHFWTPETKQLFINAEELAEDVGATAWQLWSSSSRKQPLTIIRHCIIYLLRMEYMWHYTEIGRVFKRDHATAIYAYRRIGELVEINDRQVMRYINRLSRSNGDNTQAQETEQILCSCEKSRRTQVL